jgi:LuxR family transcriptional regulator, quorum-sensing system regulator BjaR1
LLGIGGDAKRILADGYTHGAACAANAWRGSGASLLSRGLERTWSFIERAERCNSPEDLERLLLAVAAAFGFEFIFGGLTPSTRVSRAEVQERTLFQKFPDGWADRYNQRGYVFRDPIVHRLQYDRSPFSWADAYDSCSLSEDVKLIDGEASEFGLRVGFVAPIHLLDGDVAAVSFGATDASFEPGDLAALAFGASFAVGKALHHRANRKRAYDRITPREYECLLWAAEGKTDWEIAAILGVSKPTVAKHILSAREKLGAVTKGHAIAVALRAKILM